MTPLPFKKPPVSSIVMWSLVVLLIIFVVLSMTLRRHTADLEPPAEKAVPVRVSIVEPGSIADTIQLPGRIEADWRSRLAVDKGGRIVDILADKGDRVEKGQVLLRIDDRVWRAILEQAEIEAREAEKEFKRWTELSRTGAISTSEFDAVRTRHDRARVQLEEARVHVSQCEVRSPVDGVLNDRYVEVGEFAAEGAAVLELLVDDPVKLVVDVPERDIGAIRQGQTIPFTIRILDNRAFEGTVSFVAQAASPANNSYRVEALTPNPDGTLRAGMIASATIERARTDDALVAPLSAVIPRKGEHFVFIAREDRAVRRLVKIDRFVGTEVVLASGLEPGEELILEGHRVLVDGALIERVE